MTKVKICGITELGDAILAARFGADAVGFNLYPQSPRYILPENAGTIARGIPQEVLRVGVFVNASIDEILEVERKAGLDAIQLHGDETPGFVSELRLRTTSEIIKAMRAGPAFEAVHVLDYEADAILLDAYSAEGRGGTGETFDWRIAVAVRPLVNQLYLAGGLDAENVAAAVDAVRPFAVDVASGVESSPGKKDPMKLERFIKNAKNA